MARAHRVGRQIELPDPGPLAYLVETLFEAGPVIRTAMGEGPLGWSDLEAYARLAAVDLEPWEARLLVDLSGRYLAARQQGEDVLSIPPIYQVNQ